MKRPPLIAAALFLTMAVMVSPAGAQVDVGPIDPRLDFTNVEPFVSPDGNLWFELTPSEPWGDGMITDLFSWFFAVDVSNDMVTAGSILQTHDGEVTINGLLITPGVAKERPPELFLGPGGAWIRIDTGLTTVEMSESTLDYVVSAASMDTPDSRRNKFLGFWGAFDRVPPETNPLAGANSVFEESGFTPIADPIPAASIPADTTAPSSSTAPTTTPAPDSTPASTVPIDTVTSAADINDRVLDDLPADDSGGSTNLLLIVVVPSLILLAAFLLWLLWNRRLDRDGLHSPTPDDKRIRTTLDPLAGIEMQGDVGDMSVGYYLPIDTTPPDPPDDTSMDPKEPDDPEDFMPTDT